MIVINDEGLEKGKRFLKTYYASCSVEKQEGMIHQTDLCCEALDDFILQIREQIHNKSKNTVIYISDKYSAMLTMVDIWCLKEVIKESVQGITFIKLHSDWRTNAHSLIWKKDE